MATEWLTGMTEAKMLAGHMRDGLFKWATKGKFEEDEGSEETKEGEGPSPGRR